MTSRPAAFANSPGLPENRFTYLCLASINRGLIENYAEKWLKARRLEGKEASDVRRILRDKLDQPHLKELSRSPMQLAILLSLIQTQGGSLPDQRTELYYRYVQLYFNRESEKSTVVRDNRQILMDIQGYLAWILHAEAQTKKERGSIRADRLRNLVVDYLQKEEHDVSPAEQLFTGMVERVGALVSRVEGTYEFEVQPLREYFAARHLYNTAAYSPAGNPQPGTLPDRFDALSRDFYWQNVTRFYAGCYSKGELPSLVDRLEELARAPGYKFTGHPQVLAATLLSDWVFAQHPKSMKQVVALVLEGGLRQITSGTRWARRGDPLVLPKQSGNEELVDRSYELLAADPPRDYAGMLTELIQANASRQISTQKWLDVAAKVKGGKKTRWVRNGLKLGILSNLTQSQIASLLDSEAEMLERLMLLLRGGQIAFVEEDERRLKCAIEHVLGRTPEIALGRCGASLVDTFALSVNPHLYAVAYRDRNPVPLAMASERYVNGGELSVDQVSASVAGELVDRCKEVIELGRELGQLPTVEWASSLEPWSTLVEGARALFGDRWCFRVLANVSAGVRSKSETCDDASDLHAAELPLCRRARYARLRAGSAGWWESQLATTDRESVVFSLLVLLTWAGPTVLIKNVRLIDDKIQAIDSASWLRLNEALQLNYLVAPERREISIDLSALPPTTSPRTLVSLARRLSDADAGDLFRRRLSEYTDNDLVVLEFCQRCALQAALENPRSWEKWLPIIARTYSKGVVADRYLGHRLVHAIRTQPLPRATAEAIVQESDAYPVELVAMAERACRQYVAEEVIPVGIVAEKQKWF